MNITSLKLDYDGELPDDLYQRVVWTVATVLGCDVCDMRIDRTRHGYHVVILVPRRVAAVSVVALQAILGSDPKRESFNLVRARNLRAVSPFWRRERWNVLYHRHNKPSRE